MLLRSDLAVDREAGAQLSDVFVHSRFGRAVLGRAARERPQNLDDMFSDHPEFLRPETALESGWDAEVESFIDQSRPEQPRLMAVS